MSTFAVSGALIDSTGRAVDVSGNVTITGSTVNVSAVVLDIDWSGSFTRQGQGFSAVTTSATSVSAGIVSAAGAASFAYALTAISGGSVASVGAATVAFTGSASTGDMGITFVRTIGVQTPGTSAEYAYGSCTGRVVGGNTRIIFSGSETLGSPIIEVQISTSSNVASHVRTWSDPYHGKWGAWRDINDPPTGVTSFVDFTGETGTLNANMGLYWHEANQLLYVSYVDTYNVSGLPDHNLVALTLNSDGTTECYGPWRMRATNGDGTVNYGPRAGGYMAPHPTTGKMMVATTISSGNIGFPWGPNLFGGADWPTASTPVGESTSFDIIFPDRYLYYYYMGGSITPATGIATGPIRSYRRRAADRYVYEHFTGVQANSIDPEQYGGVGSWTDLDQVGGFLPLANRVYFFGALNGSTNFDPESPLAGHIWYSHVDNNYQCMHGFDAPVQVTGPVTLQNFPWIAVYSMASLEAVKNFTATDYQQVPTAEVNLDSTVLMAPVAEAGGMNFGYYNAATGKAYAISQRADRGVTTFALLAPYLHEFTVA